MGLFKRGGMAQEGRSAAYEESREKEVWRVWRKQPQGQQVSLSKAMGRRIEVETRMV